MRPPADARQVDVLLQQLWPEARCELDARDPWSLLVAVILSARTSDAQVNRVLAVLHEHLLGVAAYAELDPRDLEPLLRHLPLYRQKARAVVECARCVLRLGGVVPQDLDALARLPGVGRKTACVVAGNAFGVPAVGADTHVQRIAQRLGWTAREHPRDAELAVMARLPRERWITACHQLIRLGREHCRRLKPRCEHCPLRAICPQRGVEADQER
jgi:endonuclease III